jgi:metallo-beta-lactamase class B
VLKNVLFVVILLTSILSASENMIFVDEDIQLQRLEDSIYVHITWHEAAPYGRFSSNGLIFIKDGQALMVDTPANNEKTEILTTFLRDSLSVNVTTFIAGHFHFDCIGGLDYLHSQGVKSIACSLTSDQCKELGLSVPMRSFNKVLRFNFNGERIICRFFGGGHSFDNITVWLPEHKMLFGGCLIKSSNSKGLGNLSDAVVPEWDRTIEKIVKKYPDIKTLIPGHGSTGGSELLTYTIDLVRTSRKSL